MNFHSVPFSMITLYIVSLGVIAYATNRATTLKQLAIEVDYTTIMSAFSFITCMIECIVL